MLKAREKRIIKTILFGRIGVIILLIIVAVLAKSTWSVYQKSQFARESRDLATQELQTLQARESSLETEMQRLDTPRGLEEELRHKFDVGREGERLIVLVDTPDAPVVPEEPQKTWWRKIMEMLRR